MRKSNNISVVFTFRFSPAGGRDSRLFLLSLGLFFQLPLDPTLIGRSSVNPLEPCYKTRPDVETGHPGRIVDDRLDGEEEHVLRGAEGCQSGVPL